MAKNVIQTCVFSNNKVLSNKEMTPSEFTQWLACHKHSLVIFEACSTSNYWAQKAESLGHDTKLISEKLVSTVRQNQRTDKNDALAIVQQVFCLILNSSMVKHQSSNSYNRYCV